MPIPSHQFDAVRALNIDEHRTACAYAYWEAEFPEGTYLANQVVIVKQGLGLDFNRSELTQYGVAS